MANNPPPPANTALRRRQGQIREQARLDVLASLPLPDPLPCPCCGEARPEGWDKYQDIYGIYAGLLYGSYIGVRCCSCGLKVERDWVVSRWPAGLKTREQLQEWMLRQSLAIWNMRTTPASPAPAAE